ncbi:MAG: chromosome segregation protein SMC, partial [Gammaproteobacteria bacterium]|nr:chromosome segregation protein SMC [Gammaproteobacteria bacterium]
YRDGLHNHFLNLTEDTDCPFCGSDFDSNNTLLKGIEVRGGYFKSLLSDDDKKILELKESFVIDYLKPLINLLKLHLVNVPPPTKQLISSLEHANVLKNRLDNLVIWLSDEDIECSDLKFDNSGDLPPGHELDKRLKILQQRIGEKAPELSSAYLEENSNCDFENIFNIYFDKKPSNLNQLSVADIDNKITFILNVYSNSLGSYYHEYKELTSIIENLDLKSKMVKKTKNIIKSAISTYQKKLISDIEIPFYIYSGKILQTHQAGIGSGIFIKDKTGGQELKNIRLVSDWDSDHDVLNTMSTGQIAAIIISFYLALNKVYAQGLGTVLIDDPVQTMDEINMMSLVELLRNEFSHKQIILSTHEDHVSKYFLYKFIKYGCSASKIDLMEREEYQLSNTA